MHTPRISNTTTNNMKFKMATDWNSYTERILEVLEGESNIQMSENMNNIVQTYRKQENNKTEQNNTSPTTNELWDFLTTLTQKCASNSFGHYGKLSENKLSGLTTFYYKWLHTLNLIMADSTKHLTIDTFKDKHGKSLNRIPIDLVQPSNHESITTWRQSTSKILINLKKVYNHHKRKESNEHKLQTRRHLDNWFMRDLDRYLDEIIRPPVPQGVGAEWPTDAYGQIPTRPSDRLHVNKQIYQKKTESRIKTCPDIETIPWLKELMSTGSKFSAEAITNI